MDSEVVIINGEVALIIATVFDKLLDVHALVIEVVARVRSINSMALLRFFSLRVIVSADQVLIDHLQQLSGSIVQASKANLIDELGVVRLSAARLNLDCRLYQSILQRYSVMLGF